MKRFFLFSVLLFFMLGVTNIAKANDKMVKPKIIIGEIDYELGLSPATNYLYNYHLSCTYFSIYDVVLIHRKDLTYFWNSRNQQYCPYASWICTTRVPDYGEVSMNIYSDQEMMSEEDCPPE